MSNFYAIDENLIYLYEVTDDQGRAVWGGNREEEAIEWLFHNTIGERLFVSAWESDEEDAHMIGRPIEITKIVNSLLGYGARL